MKQSQTLLDKALEAKNKAIKKTFLTEWNPAQFKAMERAICRHFSTNVILTNKGEYPAKYRSFEALGDIMGFAYTSSSSYAGFWVCNAEVSSPKHPGFHYIGFALTADFKPYAVLWDAEENEILMPI